MLIGQHAPYFCGSRAAKLFHAAALIEGFLGLVAEFLFLDYGHKHPYVDGYLHVTDPCFWTGSVHQVYTHISAPAQGRARGRAIRGALLIAGTLSLRLRLLLSCFPLDRSGFGQ